VKGARYLSGEDVHEGDRVRYLGEEGNVEFVVADDTDDPSRKWYAEKFPGGGVMIINATFGRLFIATTEINDDLELVARSETT
jgi:hypothetical protein